MAQTRSADCTDYNPCGRCAFCRGLREAAGLTPEQRAQMIGADTSGIKAIKPGENAGMTVPMQGQSLDDFPQRNVDFAVVKEPMAEYELEDGSKIRAKMVLMRVDKVEGAFNPDGSPVYNCVFNQVTTVIPGPGTGRGRWA